MLVRLASSQMQAQHTNALRDEDNRVPFKKAVRKTGRFSLSFDMAPNASLAFDCEGVKPLQPFAPVLWAVKGQSFS